MRIQVLAVGKVKERYVAAAVDDFARRLRPYASLDLAEVPAAHGSDAAAAMREEAGRILARLSPDDVVWLLEREGEEWSSPELARRIDDLTRTGTSRLVIVVAGTFGADASLRARATRLWSLSRLTLLHEWARALALEQLYRAHKILRNEPYHH
ncbi:MAG TPA: 23S rRNA (pseudouridine(1915)-N(3))-methyltransferase RlmH [Candidatus Dormibacteraeota bacterium]|nr:23S rRNA (pseudouridine(1915)-N(3))-methyltransferase RlmH [Candidatus Dormibacteraeota bacterium]